MIITRKYSDMIYFIGQIFSLYNRQKARLVPRCFWDIHFFLSLSTKMVWNVHTGIWRFLSKCRNSITEILIHYSPQGNQTLWFLSQWAHDVAKTSYFHHSSPTNFEESATSQIGRDVANWSKIDKWITTNLRRRKLVENEE